MAARISTQVICPMHDGACGEMVEATGLEFSSTTVKVAACASLLAQGWTGPQWVGRKSQADRLLPSGPGTLRHRAGLVTFG